MLKGLEVSEIRYAQLNAEHRIDAEYYQKEYLTEDTSLSKFKLDPLGNYAFVTDGQHGYYETDENSNIHMLAARNCKDYFANLTDAIPLAKWVDDKNKRSSLLSGDIILSTRGSVGCCAIVYDEVLPANINQDVARIKLNNTDDFYPEFLITYLNCKFGRNWMVRNQTGMVQQGLPLDKVREIPIPFLDKRFQREIKELVKSAHGKLADSKSLYSEAEEILLSTLGLKDWQPNNTAVNIKKLQESFLQTGRLDAEFYQLKYDEIESIIKKYRFSCDIISNKFSLNTDVCDFAEERYNYIEIGDINVGDGSASYNIIPTEALPDNAKRVIHIGDILVSKVRPYRGAVAIINSMPENLIASGAFTVLHEKSDYKKEVLQVILRSQVYKDWLLKWNVGSSYPVIKDEDILSLPIPLIPLSLQAEIASQVQKSISLRNEAKSLLEDAKQQVENIIQTGGGMYRTLIAQSVYHYRMAEWLLLQELLLDYWQSRSAVNCSVKSFSAVQSIGRLDAEFYQQKYDALEQKLFAHECKRLGDIVSIKKSVEPGSECYKESGIPFVRVSDVSEWGISQTELHLSPADFSLEALRPHKDTILLSKDGSIGIAYKCEQDMDVITSGALLHLTVVDSSFLPDYVTLVLNSIVVRLQAERDSNGAIIQHWKPDDIKCVVIPMLALETQRLIAEKVQRSFALHSESKRLLERAKQLVEAEIESK